MNILSRLTHAARRLSPELARSDLIDAFIDSRALEYPAKIEDEFVRRALSLGVEGGMILDVGTRAGLIVLKVLWQNENFYAIGLDNSSAMIERARETATAWGLGDRAFFQVGEARRMKLKTAYFDFVISDSTLHSFDDAVSVLNEISRVLKPKGALLIRDLQRPNRLRMARDIREHTVRYGARMREHVEAALRGAFTRAELQAILQSSGLVADIIELDEHHFAIERRGETDPNSWIKAREQYL